jgi:transcriptional regulator with PAS, ATPase and Fis domain
VSRRQALGQYCCDVFRASICEQACALRRTLSSGKPVVNATAHIVNQAGEQVPIRIATALLKDKNGQVIGGVETFQDLSSIEQLQKELRAKYTFEDIVGRSAAMTKLFELLPQIAESSSTVLIEGPSGTGKELFARAIHSLSPRRKRPFIAVSCAALPDSLLESELFGHKAGAFTDARRDKPGRFALANGGTLFLDEIGDISPAMQVRLLRVLQERVIEPLGSIEPLKVDVRVIAATNRELDQLVREGRFRDDLYYRIRVISLKLPRLCQRREDIPLLVDYQVAKFNRLQGKDIAGVSEEVLARLMEYAYPGNVRELENIIEQAFVLCRGGLIELHHLPPELRPAGPAGAQGPSPLSFRAMEKLMIAEALRHHKGNRKAAALQLGIDQSTLYRKLKAFEIEPPEGYGRRA